MWLTRVIIVILSLFGVSNAFSATTIEQRVTVLENKTNNYTVVKKYARRSYKNIRTTSNQSRLFRAVYIDVPTTVVGPAIANTWVTFSGVYRSFGPFSISGYAGSSDMREGVRNLNHRHCDVWKDFPSSNGIPIEFTMKFFCTGPINPEYNQMFRAYAHFMNTEVVDVDTLDIIVKMTLEDQIEPE